MSESSGNNNGNTADWILVIVLCVLVFGGVTVDGKHYSVGCSCDGGVTVKADRGGV